MPKNKNKINVQPTELRKKEEKKKIAGRGYELYGRQMAQSQLPLWGHRYPYSMCICKQLGHHRPGKHVPITWPLFFFGTRHEKVI
jgi:hypothetical protein